jgi:hypothetical protein
MNIIEKYKNKITDYVEKKIKFFNSNVFAKFIVCMVIGILMFIPAYIVFGLYFLLGPVGFWQLLGFLTLCIFFLGAIQIGCLIIGIGLMLSLLIEA